MNPQENRIQNDKQGRTADREEGLIALYVELTGAKESLARNVYAHLEAIQKLDRGWNRGWMG